MTKKFTDTQFAIAKKWLDTQGVRVALIMGMAALVFSGYQSWKISKLTTTVVQSIMQQPTSTEGAHAYYKARFDELLDMVDDHMLRKQAALDEYLSFQAAAHRDQMVKMRESLVDVLVQNTDLITALEDGGYGVVRASRGHKITYWNGVMEEKFGYTKEEALTMTIEDLMAPEMRPNHRDWYDAAMFAKTSEAKLRSCSTARHKDGSPLEVYFLLIVPKNGGDTVALFPPFNLRSSSEAILELDRQPQQQQQIQQQWLTPEYQKLRQRFSEQQQRQEQ